MTSLQPSKVPDDLRQSSRATAFTAVMLFWAAVFAPIHLAMGGMQCTVVLISGCVLSVGILVAPTDQPARDRLLRVRLA
jgi:hypothetical protein